MLNIWNNKTKDKGNKRRDNNLNIENSSKKSNDRPKYFNNEGNVDRKWNFKIEKVIDKGLRIENIDHP